MNPTGSNVQDLILSNVVHASRDAIGLSILRDRAGLQRVTHEVWQMTKLDLAKLEKAFAGRVTNARAVTFRHFSAA
jgi:hypothetical protein